MLLHDLTNKKFGRLKVINRAPNNKDRKTQWNCICDCGNKTIVRAGHLTTGGIKSCGCKKQIHGFYNHPYYSIWYNIKQRCYFKTHKQYKNYGKRGIKMSKSWYNSFEQFCKDMKQKPTPQHTIERINNNKGYSKQNCKWATMKEQQNNKRSNRLIKFKNKTLTLSQWAELLNMNRDALHLRLVRYKWSIKKTLTTPIKKYKTRSGCKI